MFRLYQRLWLFPQDLLSRTNVYILGALSLALPLALGIAVENPLPAIIIAASGVGIAALVLLFDVRLFLAFIFPFSNIAAPHYLILILLFFLTLAFIINRIREFDLSVATPFPGLLILLVVSCLIGAAHSVRPETGIYCLRYSYLYPILAFLLVYNIAPEARLIKWNLTLFSIIASVIGFSGILLYIQTGLERQIPGWPSQNLVANYFGIMLPFTLLQLIDSTEWWKRGFWIMVFAGISVGILATQTRAVMLSSMLAVLYISWRDRRVLKIFAPAIIVGIISAPALILPRIQNFLGKGAQPDWSTIGRIEIWANSWELIKTSLINGLGINSFRYIYRIEYPHAFIPAEHPHNSIWLWWFDIGIYGFLAYCGIILSCWKRSRKKLSDIKLKGWDAESRLLLAINAGIISVLVASLMDVALHSPHIVTLFWIFMAYQLVLSSRKGESL